MHICVRGIDFAALYEFDVWFLEFDRVESFVFHFIVGIKKIKPCILQQRYSSSNMSGSIFYSNVESTCMATSIHLEGRFRTTTLVLLTTLLFINEVPVPGRRSELSCILCVLDTSNLFRFLRFYDLIFETIWQIGFLFVFVCFCLFLFLFCFCFMFVFFIFILGSFYLYNRPTDQYTVFLVWYIVQNNSGFSMPITGYVYCIRILASLVDYIHIHRFM